MEGLILVAVFGIGWKCAQLYFTIKIRSEESRRVQDRINLLEQELRDKPIRHSWD
jgi:hypothetical protein